MISATPKTILWIEDRPETVSWEEYTLKEHNYQVEFRYQPHEVKNFLSQHSGKVAGIIVDIMLRGVLYVENFPTEHGLEAGWILIEHLLRREGSPYRDIPILILSTKEKYEEGEQHDYDLTRLRTKIGGKLDYIQKRGLNARHDFVHWIETLQPKTNGELTDVQ